MIKLEKIEMRLPARKPAGLILSTGALSRVLSLPRVRPCRLVLSRRALRQMVNSRAAERQTTGCPAGQAGHEKRAGRIMRVTKQLRRILQAALLVVPILGAGLVAASGSASAAPVVATGGFGSFGGNWHVGKCLDVQYARTSPGTEIDSGWCNGTAAQMWTVVERQVNRVNESGDLMRAGVGSHMCLDVPKGVYSGSPVRLEHCNSSNGNEIWGFVNGLIHLQENWGWCLDVNDGNTGQDIFVDVAVCNGTDAQLWSPNGFTVTIQSQINTGTTANCLDDYQSATNGPVDNGPCNHGNAQTWRFNAYIRNASNGSIVQAGQPNSASLGSVSMVNSINGSWAGNLWYLQYAGYGNGGVEFINGFSGPSGHECLDVLGASPAPRQTVDLSMCNGTVAQSWNMYLT